jgi:putative aminopeptidase FrvX
MLDVIKSLCEIQGVSGDEAEVREFVISKLSDCPHTVDLWAMS